MMDPSSPEYEADPIRKLQYGVTINPVNAPLCTLCRGGNDYGVRFTAAVLRRQSVESKGTVDLCDGCLHEIGRVWVDELLRTANHDELARLLDQVALRMHRQN